MSFVGALQRPLAPGLIRLSPSERESCYSRIEMLTRELKLALKDEMGRRKDSWDADGDREEEIKYEKRKNQVYDGLKELAGEIRRALRDRSKEAVLDLWGREMEERRIQRSGSSRREFEEEVGEVDGEWEWEREGGQ